MKWPPRTNGDLKNPLFKLWLVHVSLACDRLLAGPPRFRQHRRPAVSPGGVWPVCAKDRGSTCGPEGPAIRYRSSSSMAGALPMATFLAKGKLDQLDQLGRPDQCRAPASAGRGPRFQSCGTLWRGVKTKWDALGGGVQWKVRGQVGSAISRLSLLMSSCGGLHDSVLSAQDGERQGRSSVYAGVSVQVSRGERNVFLCGLCFSLQWESFWT